MIEPLRHAFNAQFSEERYRALLASLERDCEVPIEFRISETPCFVPASVFARLEQASLDLIRQLLDDPAYLTRAGEITPAAFRMPRSEPEPTFIQVDFGLVRTGPGPAGLEGRLVELQAFPSLYGFQMLLAETTRSTWGLSEVSSFPHGLDRNAYVELMRRRLTNGHPPAEVVLMEIAPGKQKTRPDFVMTEKIWGIPTVDVLAVHREGRRLFYDRDGVRTPIRRIYNRLIPDDVHRLGLELPFDYRDDLDVEWMGAPDWFFKISKFSIPHLRHPWVPRTMLLSELDPARAGDDFPGGLEQVVLKPLFSYAGSGIVFAPTAVDLAAIPVAERHLYVCQERVSFTPVIDTPYGPTQAEIRMMLVREDAGYRCVLPLVRMGRGKMMGVDHNKGLSWVGASAALIAED